MTIVQDPLIVRLFLNTANNGWSERWPIIETDWTRGLAVAQALAQARSRIMCSTCTLIWASLATITPPYIEQYCAGPLAPLPIWGPTVTDMEGLWWRFDTDSGFGSTRIMRGIEMSEVYNLRWTLAPLDIPQAVPELPVPVTTATRQQLYANTLATFANYCGYLSPVDKLNPEGGAGYYLTPYQRVYFSYVGSYRVGRPNLPLSWEPAGYNFRPNFSPCGMIVTVGRVSYQIPCNFGQGGQTSSIHYYRAKRGAAIFTLPTIFYGWDRAKENIFFGGPGETRPIQKNDYTEGYSYGNAPGLMFSGYPGQFLGYGPPNYDGTLPMVVPSLPTCDVPRPPPPIGVGYGGLCLGGNGIGWTKTVGPPLVGYGGICIGGAGIEPSNTTA
jgi:hypothetical protein